MPPPDKQVVLELLPGSTDEALIACDQSGQSVAAAWLHVHEPPLVCDEHGRALPELVIAVEENVRGQGIGTELIHALADLASTHYSALTLNVHLLNPATRLYVRTGFRVVGAGRGWYGVAMLRPLSSH